MSEVINIQKWEHPERYGYNPYSMCSCCSKSTPVVLIEIGDVHHRAASFQLCGECKSKLKELL